MRVNHGQKSGLGAKPGVRQPPGELQRVSVPGSHQPSSPTKLSLDTSVPNLTVPRPHGFQMQGCGSPGVARLRVQVWVPVPPGQPRLKQLRMWGWIVGS